MRLVMMAAAALATAACVGDKAELGGVDNRLAAPAKTEACDPSRLSVVQHGELRFPSDAMMFVYMSQSDFSLAQAKVRYDVSEAGLPVNISYAGPPADMRHATKQKVIRAAVDAVKDTRYAWNGAPGFAAGCTFDLNVEIRNNRFPTNN
jgi:hypothetical protein